MTEQQQNIFNFITIIMFMCLIMFVLLCVYYYVHVPICHSLTSIFRSTTLLQNESIAANNRRRLVALQMHRYFTRRFHKLEHQMHEVDSQSAEGYIYTQWRKRKIVKGKLKSNDKGKSTMCLQNIYWKQEKYITISPLTTVISVKKLT